MSFAVDMARVDRNVRSKVYDLIDAVAAHAEVSIKYGSPVTGSPGQPVEFENLRKSYNAVRLGRASVNIISDLPYAEIIENNRRGAQLRSSVGGFHSIKITRIGWGRLVAYEARKIKVRSPGIRSSTTFRL